MWQGVPKCTTLKVCWARSGLAICCNSPVEIENPNLSSILSEPLIRLVRIKVTSCFRLIGALIADRLAFEVFALALALQHYLLATSRGVRMRVELIVI